MKTAIVLPALLLQRPHPKSGIKVHVRCLEDRLGRWKKGDIESLCHECLSIQSNLSHTAIMRTGTKSRRPGFPEAGFSKLITEQGGSGSLSLSSDQPDGRTVKDHLLAKHSPGVLASPQSIVMKPPVSGPHPIIFDRIAGPFIGFAALQMNGSAGPSGLDTGAWNPFTVPLQTCVPSLPV